FAQHRGFEMDSEADGFFVAFESANDAAAAAADAQLALARHDWPDGNEIRVRMGLHTGEPRAVDGRYVGLVVHAAARIMAAGTGGAGKTRLALRLASGAVEHFPNGAFFVSLAPVRDWELVVPSIAQTLGLREQPGETVLETLTEYVRDRRMLLLLDNFEQVLP